MRGTKYNFPKYLKLSKISKISKSSQNTPEQSASVIVTFRDEQNRRVRGWQLGFRYPQCSSVWSSVRNAGKTQNAAQGCDRGVEEDEEKFNSSPDKTKRTW